MVTVNDMKLPAPAGTQTAGDWRDQIPGLVRRPADHVFGKTALTQAEWRRLAHKHRKEQFVVVLQVPGFDRRVDSLPQPWQEAMGNFGYGTWAKRDWYRPDSGARLSVMAASEWHRVSGDRS